MMTFTASHSTLHFRDLIKALRLRDDLLSADPILRSGTSTAEERAALKNHRALLLDTAKKLEAAEQGLIQSVLIDLESLK
jgi:hypothetical protein